MRAHNGFLIERSVEFNESKLFQRVIVMEYPVMLTYSYVNGCCRGHFVFGQILTMMCDLFLFPRLPAGAIWAAQRPWMHIVYLLIESYALPEPGAQIDQAFRVCVAEIDRMPGREVSGLISLYICESQPCATPLVNTSRRSDQLLSVGLSGLKYDLV
ncbi:hypothetical protein NDU88_001755 [Pleurodeles waltl]|uniref:Uncharacterized protein n=1 Tax=Pleurodeles waltl TaxID=8319 RepID=A0AAV7NBN6_PLEWA|nr:hypothetical protein NDU88_001755 [Pleurodeles waltl]